MGTVTNRTSLTSRGFVALSPWNDSKLTYSVLMINLGNNFNQKLEIVSALNSFNLAINQYHFMHSNCPEKYNPKVYLGAVQTAGLNWNYDYQTGQTNGLGMLPDSSQKSGSWPVNF